ncbi:hydrogenase maturation nickel metallochaperone HypA/HybF [Arabiibacter massiliensis]|uniref:hydrogenase maturation nickel metallochaperone HypA/HybF n=1 Tax=Arabiibacter massiliensis TaxID=1870985 RepID=UPI0009B958E4|nr:hydrogenase maturation nickel metallochaperone HypA [Arabiibacter massiliensis]
MHEMSLVRNVMDIVLERAEAAGASRVVAVHVLVGEGRDVVNELFEGLFRFLARGTIAEDAELVLVEMPYMVRCNRCGAPFHLNVMDEGTWTCPRCEAARDYALVSGMELTISELEIEVEEREALMTCGQPSSG